MNLFHKNIKKLFVVFVAVILFSICSINTYADETVRPDKSFDVIFVIDCSSSMNTNDPNKLALTASKLFIDLLSNTNSYAGYVFFADSATPTRPLQKINGNEDSLKSGIGSAEYKGTTRMNLGLSKAYEFFETHESDNERLVILLSDGKSTVAIEIVDEQVNKFKSAGIPIYTIGLTKEADSSYMQTIADTTGAFYEPAQAANDLAGIFGKIYINLMNGDYTNKGDFSINNPVPVTIDAEKAEAYIILSSEKYPINVFAVKKPNGDFYSGKILEYDNCAIIKIDDPDAGWWNVSVTGTRDDNIKLDLLTVHIIPREVNFIEDGKTLESITIKNGKSLQSVNISEDIINRERENYDFGGWYSDEEYNNLYDFASPVWSNINLYAKWTPYVYTVSFKMYDDNIIIKNFNHGETIEFPEVPNRRGGYRFIGWYQDEKSLRNPEDIPVMASATALSDLYFFAEWEYEAVSLSLLFIMLGVTVAIVLFSIIVFPRIIPSSIIHNQWITASFALINNLLICASAFIFYNSFASVRIFDQASTNSFLGISFNLYFIIGCFAIPAVYNIYAAYIAPYISGNYKKLFIISIALTIIFTAGSAAFTLAPVNIFVMLAINAAVYFVNFFISALTASSSTYPNYRFGG